MKAYAVVRKPNPSNKTISHIFKVETKNPEISIDPIQENASINPRKAECTQEEYLIQSNSRHYRIQESFTQQYRQSKSPVRKHPIFNQMISEFIIQKKRKQTQQKLNSSKLQKSIEGSLYEQKSINFSNGSEQKIGSQVKVSRQELYTTPQKVNSKIQKPTPYQLLNSSERERQTRPFQINRKNRIFEQYRNTSKQKRQSYLQQQKRQTFKRPLGPQLQFLQRKSQQASNQQLIMQRQATRHKVLALGSNKHDYIRDEDLSSSEIDIGCCGEQLRQNKTSHYSVKNESMNYRPDTKRDNPIMNSRGLQFMARSLQKSRSKSRRKIFNHTNPQLQKSYRQTQNFKQDKINAKPLINQPNPKQRKVVVFEVNPQSPFEF